MMAPFLPVGYVFPWKNDDYMGIRTHSRYAVNIYALLRANHPLTFNLTRSNNYPPLNNEDRILKKLEIVKYTLNSIKSEKLFTQQDNDFLPLSLSWLWIKGYYAVFHLMSLLISLERNDPRYMLSRPYNDHYKILEISNQIIASDSPFNLSQLNVYFNGLALSTYKSTGNINVKNVNSFDSNLYQLSLKKVYKDELEKLKGIPRLQKKAQVVRLNSNIYTVFNIFHNYRERFNYSGFQYLECDTLPYNQSELIKFYECSYVIITMVSKSITNYLSSHTSGNLKKKLIEIQNLL